MSIRNRFRGTASVSQWLRQSGAAPIFVRAGTITVGNGSATGTDAFTSAVDPAQSLLIPCGVNASGNVVPAAFFTRLSMDANGATATRNTADTIILTVGYMLLVFPAGTFRTVQRGTVDLSGGLSNTAALSPSVDTARPYLVASLGFTTVNATSGDAEHFQFPRVNLTAGGASVTGTTGQANATVAFQVAQWA